jgi:hypothetical protein
MMAHKMTVYLNVFSALMKNIVMRNLNRTSVVTEYRRARSLRSTHIMEEPS